MIFIIRGLFGINVNSLIPCRVMEATLKSDQTIILYGKCIYFRKQNELRKILKALLLKFRENVKMGHKQSGLFFSYYFGQTSFLNS